MPTALEALRQMRASARDTLKQVRKESTATLPGESVRFDEPTWGDRLKSGTINIVGGALENAAGVITVPLGAMAETVAHPLRSARATLAALREGRLPTAEEIPKADVMRFQRPVEEAMGRGIRAAENAVGVNPNAILDDVRAFARTAGGLVDPPIARLAALGRVAKATDTAADVAKVTTKADETATAAGQVRQYLATNPDTPRDARPALFRDGLDEGQRAAITPEPPVPGLKEVPESRLQWLHRWTTETATALRRQGRVGNEIAEKLFATNREASQMAARPVEALKALKRLTRDEAEQFIDLLEGKVTAAQVPDRVRNIAAVHQRFLAEFGDAAEKAGLMMRTPDGTVVPFSKRADYFPHINPDDVDAPLFVGRTEIEPGARVGSLEHVRTSDAPYLREPVTALATYYSGAARKLAEVKHFGSDVGDAVRTYVTKASAEGVPTDFVRDALTRTLGGGARINQAERGLASAAMNLQVITKLPAAVIGNATQTAYTVAKSGFKNTAHAALDMLRSKTFREPEILDEAIASGATLESLVNELVAGKHTDLLARTASNVLAKTGFTAVERFNRLLAAQAGIRTAEELSAVSLGTKKLPWYGITNAQQRATADLQRMGVDVANLRSTGALSAADKANAGFWMSHKTQFGTRFEDLPLGWSSSPVAKVLLQFKGFSFKSGKFMKDELVKPALRGDVAPLARFVAAAGLFGGASETARQALFGQLQSVQDIDARKQLLDGLTAMAMGNILAGMFRAGKYGGARGVAEMAAGPTLADAYRWTNVGANLSNRLGDAASYAAGSGDASAITDVGREIVKETAAGEGAVAQAVRRSVPLTKVVTNRIEK